MWRFRGIEHNDLRLFPLISFINKCINRVKAIVLRGKKQRAIPNKLTYRDVDGIAELLKKIVYRAGISDMLAEEVRPAAKEWGMEDVAVHVKGLEPSGYHPRVLKGMALA